MDIEKFSHRMIEIMPQCIRGFARYESNYLSSGNISLPQFWVLEYLSRRPDCLMCEIADFLGISRPAATGLVDRLIAQQMLSRDVDPSDRRAVKVRITAKGRKIVSGVWEQKRRGLVKVFSQISGQARQKHLQILEQIVKILADDTIKSKIIRLIVVGSLWLGLSTASVSMADEAPLTDLTLQQAYQLALDRSETIAIQKEIINQAEGRFLQSLSGALPKVNFVGSEKRQDGSGGSSFTIKEVPEAYFTFEQPLFSGFKEFAAMSAAKAEKRQYQQELIHAKQTLFKDVVDAYYLLKDYQEGFDAIMEIHKLLEERVNELKKRESLGKSRSSEVASAESKLYQNEADMQSIRSEFEVTKQLLEFLVGKKIETLSAEDIDIESFAIKEDFLSKVNLRPEVLARQEAVTVAQKKVGVAKAGYFPTLSLLGNSYVKRVGSAGGVDWDIALSLNFPIFNGGLTAGEVKEARSLVNQAKLSLGESKRKADLDIQNAHSELLSGQRQMSALKKALDAAQKNYELQKADYQNNLVNNLEVLQSLEDFQEVRQRFIAIKNDSQRAYWDFKTAIGEMP